MGLRSIRFLSNLALIAARETAGLSQRQLAERAHCHVQTVKYWEGQRLREDYGGLYGKAIDRMADALGIPSLGEAYAMAENARPSRDMIEWLGLTAIYSKPAKVRPRFCGATLPSGTKCKKMPVAERCRCSQHGGLSTGPKTEQGRQVIRAAQIERWKAHGTLRGGFIPVPNKSAA